MTRKKANVRPDLVGELFTDGKDYFKLIECQTEPVATFENINYPNPEKNIITKPISEFAHLVLLKPVRPIEKLPVPRKPRSDAGTHRVGKRLKPEPIEDSLEVVDQKGDNLTIHVPTGLKGDTEYKVTIAGSMASGDTLRETVLIVLDRFNQEIPDALSAYEKKTIQDILDAGK